MPPALQQEVLGDAVIYRDNPAADSEEAAQLPGSSAPERSQPMETAQPEQEAAAEPASSAGPGVLLLAILMCFLLAYQQAAASKCWNICLSDMYK